MTGKGTFLGLYRKLNPEQKRAVDAIEGPVMVIAGPGTGKTQILTLRIANILRKTDTAPDSILALTFTESGVFSMRTRLVEIVGSAAYRVHIHTFHGFCNDVIRRFPDSFPTLIGSEHIHDIDKIALLKELILLVNLKRLKPFGDNFYYLHDILKGVSDIKRENISPETLHALVKKEHDAFFAIGDLYYQEGKYRGLMRGKYRSEEKRIEKNADLALLYEEYQKALAERKYYDYEDMIMQTIRVLETDTDLLLSLQEEFQYLLADEHQDANNSQNRLLELLASFHEQPNLFIVGDEKQAIFRFQGASLENFQYFKKRYPDALVVALRENYRSRQFILDSAHSLLPSDTPLSSQTKSAVPLHISVRAFSKTAYEYAFLARDIQVKLDEGVPPEEIAVLYRTNSDADTLVRIFEKTNIPFVVESSQNVLADTEVRKFLLILRAVSEFGNDGAFLDALHIDFLGVDPLDLYKAVRYANKKRIPPFAVISSLAALKKAGANNAKTLYRQYATFRAWKKAAGNKPLLDLFEIIANESGFIAHVLSQNEADAILSKVRGLFDDLALLVMRHREYRLSDYLDYLTLLDEHGIAVTKDARRAGKRVRLMTAHKSKGLEFDYVYIVGARDAHWGRRRKVTHFSVPFGSAAPLSDDDERRLFYVALTRARDGVFISYARENERGAPESPSQFIEEIDKALIDIAPTDEFEKSVRIENLLAPKKERGAHTLSDKTFLNELFLEQGLSVTALNNYLACPWNYFYSNLLRLPKRPNKYMLFGTAVHNALARYYHSGAKSKSKKKNAEILISYFYDALSRQPLSEKEYEEMQKKGKKALSGYRPHLPQKGERVRTELTVPAHLPRALPDSSPLLLRGVLDRLDIAPSGREVVVTDYKTGKPKSRNAIEGKTKSSGGDYKRQLVFYKLLLELYDGGRYDMTEGVIDFVEPDERGKYREERFVITDEDVALLKDTIQKVAEDILALAFWNTRCDDTACRFCALRDVMQ